MFHSIRTRLVVSFVLLAVLTVGAVGLMAVEIVRQVAFRRELSELQSSADAIALQASPWMSPTLRRTELSQLVRTTAFLGNMRVRILDAQKNPLVDSGAPGDWNDVAWIATPQDGEASTQDNNSPGVVIPLDKHRKPENQTSLQRNLPPGSSLLVIRRNTSAWGGRISFVAQLPAAEKNAANPTSEVAENRSDLVVQSQVSSNGTLHGYIEISSGPNFAAEALATTEQALGLAAVGAILLAAVLGLVMGSRLAYPLQRLSESAAQMGAGNLAARSGIRSRDEIGELAREFNLMAERLQASFAELGAERDALRRFIADASHELRTPITALKNFNQLLLGPASGDPPAQEEFLQESQVQIDRLEWITQNLLNLSRMDAGLVQLDYEECDAGELIQSAVAPFKALAAGRGIDLRAVLPEQPVSLTCDRGRMVLVLSNLLDNALKYSPAGSQVAIYTSRAAGKVRFWVEDGGPGLIEADLPHIFERFYRGRNAVGAGSGLGLSIVSSFVQAHAGQVWAENCAEGGARFTVEL